ncbi:MAG: hypothetical protein LLG04_09565 [Parachlamydia sp.]|nr:hypothetical protein [Parachlamydia sp.]
MLKMSHAALAMISGLIWMAVGCSLLSLGLKLLLGNDSAMPLIQSLSPSLGGAQQVALLLVAVGLFVGYMKGRHVLAKSASKGIERIKTLPNPASLAKIYSPGYYLLLGGMMFLGMSIKFFGIPSDIRGMIDVAIGAALIQGSLVYIRFAIDSWQTA